MGKDSREVPGHSGDTCPSTCSLAGSRRWMVAQNCGPTLGCVES